MASVMVEGYRVFRGPDWCYADVDGGDGALGTVVDTDEEGKVEVIWDNGTKLTCRAGSDGKHDLRIFDTGPAGVRHGGQSCVVCEAGDIQGALWRCSACRKCVMCSGCYFADKHDLDHAFLRLDCPNSDGEEMAPRSVSDLLQTKGIFPSCNVFPEPHFALADLAGGAAGTVERLDKTAGKLYVKWSNGQTTHCRLGYRGHVDLRCDSLVPGPQCYREHAPVLDLKTVKVPALVWSSSTGKTVTPREQQRHFEMNEKVFIELTQDLLEARQRPQEEGSTALNGCLGKVGVVRGVASNGDVIVRFQGLQLNLSPQILRKVPILSPGDTVRIDEDEEKVKLLEEEHGGWNSEMKQILGKVGKVIQVEGSGDAYIAFGERFWLFNPACCIHAPGATLHSISSSSGSGGSGLLGAPGVSTRAADQRSNAELQQMLGRLLMMGSSGDFQSVEALLRAAVEGNVDKVTTMISQHPELVNMSSQGLSPLFLASHEGHLNVVKALVEAGASLEATDSKGNTALGAALIGKKVEVAKYLIDKGASVSVALETGATLMHVAAANSLCDVIPLLVEKGCDVNAKDHQGVTALQLAIEKDANAAIETLVKTETIDLRVYDPRGFNPLQQACFKGNAIATEVIVKRDKTVVDGQTKDRVSALHIAALNGRTECIEKLLVHGGATVNLRASGDTTPLHLACIQNQFSAAKELVKRNADVNAKTDSGHTALHFVLNARNRQDGNFLQMTLAMASGCSEELQVQMSCFLLEHGAIVDELDGSSKAPVDYCHSDVVKTALKNFIKSKPPGVIKFRESPPSKGLEGFGPSSQGCGLGSGSGSSSGSGLGSGMGSNGGSGLGAGLGSSRGSGLGFGTGPWPGFGFRLGPGMGLGSGLGHGMGQGHTMCRVCQRVRADISVEPCNHRVLCETCCLQVERCPQCLAVILARNPDIVIGGEEPCKLQ